MSTVTALRPADSTQPSEREVRVALAACYRLIAHFRMDDLVYTHISARVPGTDHFLINPYGMMFHEITASSLVKIDYDGNIVEPSEYPVNQAGFVIHSAVHRARKDVNCVLHTHTRAGVAVSCLEEGLLPLNQFSLFFYGRVAYHDYEGIALDLEERERLVEHLGDKSAMILRSHGLLTAGRDVPEAFQLMYYLEQSCRVQLDVMSSGGRMIRPPQAVCDRTAAQVAKMRVERPITREWPALLRLLDAKDPSYRS
jgi:ribulose-5-phosphate 4-epimerase/fuculose-1-phosphate aldolase